MASGGVVAHGIARLTRVATLAHSVVAAERAISKPFDAILVFHDLCVNTGFLRYQDHTKV